jgi:hypothetical protein
MLTFFLPSRHTLARIPVVGCSVRMQGKTQAASWKEQAALNTLRTHLRETTMPSEERRTFRQGLPLPQACRQYANCRATKRATRANPQDADIHPPPVAARRVPFAFWNLAWPLTFLCASTACVHRDLLFFLLCFLSFFYSIVHLCCLLVPWLRLRIRAFCLCRRSY